MDVGLDMRWMRWMIMYGDGGCEKDRYWNGGYENRGYEMEEVGEINLKTLLSTQLRILV